MGFDTTEPTPGDAPDHSQALEPQAPAKHRGFTRPSFDRSTGFVEFKTVQAHQAFVERKISIYRQLSLQNKLDPEQMLMQILERSRMNWPEMTKADRLTAYHSIIALAKITGEDRLACGTKLNMPGEPQFVLRDLKLDVGGAALHAYTMSQDIVDLARGLTGHLMGQQIDGRRILIQDAFDLEQTSMDVAKAHAVICGKHNIQKAFDELVTFLNCGITSNGTVESKNITFYKTFIEDINKRLGEILPHALQHRLSQKTDRGSRSLCSKLLRDQALVRMVLIDVKLMYADPNGAKTLLEGSDAGRKEVLPGSISCKGYDGVDETLRLSETLAGSNADLPDLKGIAQRLAQRVKIAFESD